MTVLLYLHHHTFISKKLCPCYVQDYKLYIIHYQVAIRAMSLNQDDHDEAVGSLAHTDEKASE